MVFHNVECQTCGYLVRDYVFQSYRSVTPKMFCPSCGFHSFQIVYTEGFQFDPNASGLYGKYYPCFGRMVRSYGDKRRLLKEFGQVEAGDLLGGSREWEQPKGYNGPDHGQGRERRGKGGFSKTEKAGGLDLDDGWTLGEALVKGGKNAEGIVRRAAEKAAADFRK